MMVCVVEHKSYWITICTGVNPDNLSQFNFFVVCRWVYNFELPEAAIEPALKYDQEQMIQSRLEV